MNIGVRGGNPKDYSGVSAEEQNRSMGPLQKDIKGCLLTNNEIYVYVPPKLPGITCQTDPEAYACLVRSFEVVIKTASSQGSPSVAIPALGVVYQKWKHLQSASAARKAVENIWEEIPDDFTVFFCVPYDQVELWDQVMTF